MMAPHNPQPAPNHPEGIRGGATDSPAHKAEDAGRPVAASHAFDDAARAVMHPEMHDPDWRYYFGAWGG